MAGERGVRGQNAVKNQTGSGSFAVASESPCFLVPRMDRPGHQGAESGPGAGHCLVDLAAELAVGLGQVVHLVLLGPGCQGFPGKIHVCVPRGGSEQLNRAGSLPSLPGRVDDVSDHQLHYGAPAPDRLVSPGQTDLPLAAGGPQGQLGALVLQGAHRKPAAGGASGCHNIWGPH